MKKVIDASFTLSALLPDEQSAQVIEAFKEYKKGQIRFVAPIILPFEVANGLGYAVKSKRIKKNLSSELLETFFKLDISLLETNLEKTLQVSLEKELSIYDASYIFLARELNAPLLTLDERLKRLSLKEN